MRRIYFPWEDPQDRQPTAWCARCGGELYGEVDDWCFPLCGECRAEEAEENAPLRESPKEQVDGAGGLPLCGRG